jgi:hypothetical protein
MKTQDLRDSDLDSIWTPGRFSGRFGLHVDSTNGQSHQPCSGTELASTRAVDPAFWMFAHERGDNIDLLYKDGSHGSPRAALCELRRAG